jgi:hypothetical protein
MMYRSRAFEATPTTWLSTVSGDWREYGGSMKFGQLAKRPASVHHLPVNPEVPVEYRRPKHPRPAGAKR